MIGLCVSACANINIVPWTWTEYTLGRNHSRFRKGPFGLFPEANGDWDDLKLTLESFI